jgi:ferredoxin
MKRKIVTINEDLCDGCGNCVTACSEGALKIVDGKAKLAKEDFCDGFGDCIGDCPTGALTIEERESSPFDEEATKEYLLKTRGKEAVLKMEEAQKKHTVKEHPPLPCGCPGSFVQTLNTSIATGILSHQKIASQLRNWPVQITLLPVKAPFYNNADVLVAADCCAYAYGSFHNDFIKDRTLAIGCPKLDNANEHEEKLTAIFTENNIKSVTVSFMEVPCCMGLLRLVEEAVRKSGKDIPLMKVMIGISGDLRD